MTVQSSAFTRCPPLRPQTLELPRQQHKEVPPVLRGHDRVQIGVRARIQGVEEHQQYLRPGDPYQGVADERRQREERHRRPAREVREDEQRHLLRDGHLALGAAPARLVRQAEVDLGVAEDYEGEGQTCGKEI